ncbi:MAG: glycosyltransferase family 4 protein [Verrucomicrobia bacterium]|nr:glycosyltransferase family 4 protein [Verrucomicrobiota bacterium]MCH8514413.1 glycosyltransferase family 4 protein [Kiritimatiellia bacterium]
MKIGINTLFFIPGQVGGSETYLLEILRVWKKQALPHEFVLFSQLENDTLLRENFAGDGWDVPCCAFRAENRFVRILREQIELPRRVKKAGCDLLWSPGYTAPFHVACPQAVSILDMQYKHHPEDLSFLARWTTEALLQGCTRRRPHRILTISEFSRQEILRFTPARPEQISVTPLAADPVFAPRTADTPDDQAPYLLCVANTYPHKAVDRLVRAFGLISNEIPHQLWIIGRPRRGEAAFQAALESCPDPHRVLRKSGLSRAELCQVYAGAALFVFPSLYEGFGLPVLEAMQAGLPVLTTRQGSIPEVGGDAVAYVDPPDPETLAEGILRRLKAPEAETAAFREKARLRAATFTWEKTAENTLALLEEHVRNRSS